MTLSEAYEKRRQENLALQRENAKLKHNLDKLREGTYVDSEKAAHLKQINKLTQRIIQLEKKLSDYKEYWRSELNINSNLRYDNNKKEAENSELRKENSALRAEVESLQSRLDAALNLSTQTSSSSELSNEINALKNEIIRLSSIASNDGNNSGLPTSQTPISKKKKIPNSRKKSGKKRGAQPGHQKHSLCPANESEITEFIDHFMDSCPSCGSNDISQIDVKLKDVIDYEVRVIKHRHRYAVYQCNSCGKVFHMPIPVNHKETAQYGSAIQAMALVLVNLGFVSINRAKKIIDGFMQNQISISEGYICKLQKRASNNLRIFCDDVSKAIIQSPVVHWDDTVVFVDTKRACIRFYGNDSFALYKAHSNKNRKGLDKDAILGALGEDTYVMHDHNLVNYNEDFVFKNIECNQHLLRDIQKVIDLTNHSWAITLYELIQSTIHNRKLLVAEGKSTFSDQEIYNFKDKIDEILKTADKEYQSNTSKYSQDEERKLITRLKKYRENYFMWVADFSLPTTNNISESALRGIKTRQKVSGQFISIPNAEYFASIRTYIETCARNGVGVFDALSRLASANPYTLEEIISDKPSMIELATNCSPNKAELETAVNL